MRYRPAIPPKFKNGQALSAASLNALADYIEWIHGMGSGANLPYPGLRYNDDLTSANNRWYVRHRGRYLHYKFTCDDGTHNRTKMYYDGTKIMDTDDSDPLEGYIDLYTEGVVSASDLESWFTIYLEVSLSTAVYTAHYIVESASTSLSWPSLSATSYDVPPRWDHGDVGPTQAQMDYYNDGLEASRDLLGDILINPAIYWDYEQGPYTSAFEGAGLGFIHKYRWLHYRGTGAIVDPAGVEDAVTVTDQDAVAAYDLDSVSWLVYGQSYRVEGCTFACEDYVP